MSPNPGAKAEPDVAVTSDSAAATFPPAKKGLPVWVSALVIVAFLVAVYFVFQKLTAERPVQLMPGSAKAGQSKSGGSPSAGGGAHAHGGAAPGSAPAGSKLPPTSGGTGG